jgi:hypothetical protein
VTVADLFVEVPHGFGLLGRTAPAPGGKLIDLVAVKLESARGNDIDFIISCDSPMLWQRNDADRSPFHVIVAVRRKTDANTHR